MSIASNKPNVPNGLITLSAINVVRLAQTLAKNPILLFTSIINVLHICRFLTNCDTNPYYHQYYNIHIKLLQESKQNFVLKINFFSMFSSIYTLRLLSICKNQAPAAILPQVLAVFLRILCIRPSAYQFSPALQAPHFW